MNLVVFNRLLIYCLVVVLIVFGVRYHVSVLVVCLILSRKLLLVRM